EGIERARGRLVGMLGDPGVRGLVPLQRAQGSGAVTPAPALGEIDVVFPVLHGTYGEDGTIQGLLELANVPYVGAGVLSSAVAMDKVVMKDLFTRHGLPVTAYRGFRAHRWRREPEAVLDDIEEAFGWPVFVKPANLGSSVGVHKCSDRDGLRAGIADAFRYDRKVIVEEAVPDPREIEVSVLGNEEPLASVPGEILPSREFYDYRAKYLDDASQLLIPAPLDEEQAETVRSLAVAAYRAVEGEGMARVDFLLSRTTGRIYVNEVNTIPGFTRISMYPKLWEASGVPYPELIDRLIGLAIQRWEEKQGLTTHYDPGPAGA
ncbi:MAG TPA: D-alanine--D-alanine ligase family protein, partial [Bacillota bacterium]